MNSISRAVPEVALQAIRKLITEQGFGAGDALPDGVQPPGNPGVQRVRTHSFGLIWSTMPLACAAMGPVGASLR